MAGPASGPSLVRADAGGAVSSMHDTVSDLQAFQANLKASPAAHKHTEGVQNSLLALGKEYRDYRDTSKAGYNDARKKDEGEKLHRARGARATRVRPRVVPTPRRGPGSIDGSFSGTYGGITTTAAGLGVVDLLGPARVVGERSLGGVCARRRGA